ncbi:hypothetical protein V3N95_11590 (plasmid) [Micrococcaceae bacterium Sec6.3]
MSAITTEHLSLAGFVALRIQESDHEQGRPCIAWVESRDRRCGATRDTAGGLLCTRHKNVAAKRRAAARAKETEQKARRLERERARLPLMREELAQLEDWIARHEHVFAAPMQDRAATGGAAHPSIEKKVTANWNRGLKLWGTFSAKSRRAEELRRRIAAAA